MKRKMSWRLALCDERGAISIEMALITLMLSGLMFGVVELARYGLLRYHLDRATYHAARYLALNPNEKETARMIVEQQVARNVWSKLDDVQLLIKNAPHDGRCLQIVETRASYTITELTWLVGNPSVESAQVWGEKENCGQPAAQLQIAIQTPTPLPTLPIARTPFTLRNEIEGMAIVNANIRLGPGFEYAIVGRLSETEMVQVRGRDETATWLQITPERVGWVYAPLIQMDEPVSSLQVVASPPLPLNTPAPPPHFRFDAKPRVLKIGECAWLSWEVADASFVTLNEKNVAPQGKEQVCPTADTKYVLSAGYAPDQFFDREVRIMIYPAIDP
jgi:hypothetical protein